MKNNQRRKDSMDENLFCKYESPKKIVLGGKVFFFVELEF